MNSEHAPERTALAYVAGILGCFLIVVALVWALRHYSKPTPLGGDRAAVRAQALAELRGVETDALNNTAWIDQNKGLVRMRIDDAMKLVEREWAKDPSAARSNLISRVEKANPPPPKPAPSPFE